MKLMPKNSRGVTLIEALIGLSISVVAGLLLISIFIQNNGVTYNQSLKTSQGLGINNAYSKISAVIRSASSIVTSYTLSNPTYTTSASVLVMKLPAINSQGSAIDSVYDYIVITPDAQNSQILRELVFPDPSSSRAQSNQILTNNLKSITFSYLDTNKNPVPPTSAVLINFVINLTGTQGLDTQQSSASGQINLRNN